MGDLENENSEICGNCEFWNGEEKEETDKCGNSRGTYLVNNDNEEIWVKENEMCELGEAYSRVKRELELERERLNEIILRMGKIFDESQDDNDFVGAMGELFFEIGFENGLCSWVHAERECNFPWNLTKARIEQFKEWKEGK